MKTHILNALKKNILVLDGATGTELQKRGMPTGVCPEKWCLHHPDILKQVHREYAAAGSNIIYASTFGANRSKLSQYHITDIYHVNKNLSKVARQAAGPNTLVAGDIGPTGLFVEPFGSLRFDEAVDIFKEQIKGLLAGGVDLIVIETMMDIQEARAAVIAAKELTNKFIMVTMTYEPHGRTLNGNDPLSALITLQSLGADAVGCNCSTGPQDMLKFIETMKPAAMVPLVAKPNAGIPKFIHNQTFFDMRPQEFALFAKKLICAGVSMIGGCCGTTPEHIRAVKDAVKNLKPKMPQRKSLNALSSAKSSVILNNNKDLIIIGECINPTGKKDFQKELLTGKMTILRQLAATQEKNGAHILDVNVGSPGIDEKSMLAKAVSILSIMTSLPLCIDSSNVDAVEEALKIYPGRALINSISGDKKNMRRLFNLAKKYGAMFILLPLAGKTLPHTFLQRKKIIQAILTKVKKASFERNDIIIDTLAMTISYDPQAAIETLKTIAWCAKKLKYKTTLGLSNVSFGMPQRQLINASFLKLAKAKGLSSAIADPANTGIKTEKHALNLLLHKKGASDKFIAYYAKRKPVSGIKKEIENIPLERRIFAAILEGDKEQIIPLIDKALNQGKNAFSLMQEGLIKAITEVGDKYKNKEYFLPQLIASAETMKKGLKRLEPCLSKDESQKTKKQTILLATVEGDIHDIGKNIVALMLKNHGFLVIDLGKDVPARKIIEKTKQYKPAVVGLSALMTTTMMNMQKVVEEAKKEKVESRFLLGGAVVTSRFAESLGCAYAKDSVEAVRVAQKITSSIPVELI